MKEWYSKKFLPIFRKAKNAISPSGGGVGGGEPFYIKDKRIMNGLPFQKRFSKS
jgi:hypothetical protein